MDAALAPDGSSIIAALSNCSSYRGIYRQISSFLIPFADLIPNDFLDAEVTNKKKNKTRRKKKSEEREAENAAGHLRSLAKQFLPFLSQLMKLLHSIVKNLSKGSGDQGRGGGRVGDEDVEKDRVVDELLRGYKLAVDCLQCVMPCLAGKPYSVHFQRSRLVCCLEACGKYDEAEEMAFSLLESLREVINPAGPATQRGIRGKTGKVDAHFLPTFHDESEESGDPDLSALVVEISISIVGCSFKSKRKDGASYDRIIALAEELQPWLRARDTDAYGKCRLALANALYKCSLFLVRESIHFNVNLVQRFCTLTLRECSKTSLRDQLPNISCRICSSFDLKGENRYLIILDMLRFFKRLILCKCKVDVAHNVNDIFECIFYCVESLSGARIDISKDAFKLLSDVGCDLVEGFSTITLILKLYAIGLYFSATGGQSNHSGNLDDWSAFTYLIGSRDCDLVLINSLDFLSCNLFSNGSFLGINCVMSKDQMSTNFSACQQGHGKLSLLSCFNALEFSCKSLGNFITVAWKDMVSEGKPIQLSPNTANIYDMFNQFYNLYFVMDRSVEMTDKQRVRLSESRGSLLVAIVTALKISIGTNRKKKDIEAWVVNLISSEWIKAQELKFLVSSLYNTGATLYNVKQVEQASIALRVSCIAVWSHVKLICQMSLAETKGSCMTSSNDAIKDAVADACGKSAAIFGILCRCNNVDTRDLMVNSLLAWATAQNISNSLISPCNLVKSWVKIMCRDIKDWGTVDDVPLLYFLLNHHKEMSKNTIGIILEQELLAYMEMGAQSPNLCDSIQRKIIDILLQDIYATEEFSSQRAKVLVIKGKSLRTSGFDGLQSCIHCLSEAILLFKGVFAGHVGKDLSYHQLAVTYCLRAQCVHEANQNLETILDDIRSALYLWSRVNFQVLFCNDDHFDFMKENTILLFYSIADLMSLKGCMEFQIEILKLAITYWKLKNFPLERCIAMLWQDRRLNHALCPLPIDTEFINSASQNIGIDANSFDVWLQSLKDMPSAALGFLQKLLLSDFILPQVDMYDAKRSLGYKVTTEEVEAAASSLISNVPLTNHVAYSAAYLYYDLSERLSLDGNFFEALKYAQEALRLRIRIVKKKFIHSTRQQSTGCESSSQTTSKGCNQIHLEGIGSVITEMWPCLHTSQDLEHSFISPWNILRCYLESLLQVALLHETIGDGVEAEIHLDTGRKISILQGLPFCQATFSCYLGQVYCRKQQYDLAKIEFHTARNVLLESDMTIMCKCCKLVLDVNVDMQMGDLSLCLSKNNTTQTPSSKDLSCVIDIYKSALERLNDTNLGIPVCNQTRKDLTHNRKVCSTKTERRSFLCFKCAQHNDSLAYSDNGAKKSTNVVQPNIESNQESITKGIQKRSSRHLRSKQNLPSDAKLNRAHSHDYSASILDPDVSHEGEVNYYGSNCWTCFLIQISVTGSMQDMIYQKWECHRRRLLVKLLSRIGKCSDIRNGVHNVHDLFLKSISMLCMKDPCHQTDSKLPYPLFLKFIEEERSGDTFSMERAVILCDMSFFFVKNCLSENTWAKCCCLSDIQLPSIISWLLRAFMLAREFPLLFQKIAQLLATLFLLSTLGGNYSLPSFFTKTLSISHLAAYFHQASLGAFLHWHFSVIKENDCNLMDERFLCVGTTKRPTNRTSLFRFVPEKLNQFEECVNDFFLSLPHLTIICISFLDDNYINILGEALLLTSFVPTWLFLSRFCSDGKPIAILLPVDTVNEESMEDDPASRSRVFYESKESIKMWQCPWGDTVIDYVAPHFKSMLEENYLSLSNFIADSYDTNQSRFKWWSQRTRLNNRLSRFLRRMEDMWLGPWKCLLLGERSDHESVDNVLCKLVSDLKYKCKIETNQSLLKAIIGGVTCLKEAKSCFHQLLLYGGCFGRGECCGEGRFRAFSAATDEAQDRTEITHQLLLEAASEVLVESTSRDPIVLILDNSIQMLPWENIPVLRKQEVYRMPSIGSISLKLKGRSCQRNTDNLACLEYPLVDPLNTYYLLNPSGDLCSTQVEFEEWFRHQKWKGKAGNAPSIEELADALQNHDLFVYFGHGSGTQYIPSYEIRKMNRCSATLLMGCSSGSLSLKGCYAPQGAPLSFLLAGSPIVIANLWEVTDKDIDRFGKAMLNSWLREESVCHCCSQYSGVIKKIQSMKIDTQSHSKSIKTRSKISKEKKLQELDESRCRYCNLKRITFCMSEARDACKLPLLIGASPVCYGVPTLLRKNTKHD